MRDPQPPDQETKMNFFHEYALLVAAAIPVATVVGINVFLMIAGEKGTLLFPSLGRYPSHDIRMDETPSATSGLPASAAANDEVEREAA
jgi:hypothetical protein